MAEEVRTEETNQEELEQGQTDEVLTKDIVDKMIQSATDKVRTEYSTKLRDVEKEKENLVKEKMSEDEQRQFDLDQLTKTLEDKEREIANRELTIKTVDLLKDKDLPLDFRDFVIGNDEETTVKRVEKFGQLWTKALEEAVGQRFKDNGRNFESGKTKATTKEEILAIKDNTKRIRAIQANPELFKQ